MISNLADDVQRKDVRDMMLDILLDGLKTYWLKESLEKGSEKYDGIAACNRMVIA